MAANPYGDAGVALPFEGPRPPLQPGPHRGSGFRGRGGGGGGGFRPPQQQQRPPSEMHMELNKPWVNGYLAKQIRMKFDLKYNSGQSKRLEDWQAFAKQRDTVKSQVAAARSSFFAKNPGSEDHWLPILAMESGSVRQQCSTCEWDFRTEPELLRHEEDDHVTCGLDGCSFTAGAPKTLEIHILHMHSSGLYNKVHQQGNTPEDIQKWRAERRKNYPSVAKSAAAEEQRKFKEDRKQKYLAKLQERREEIDAKRKKHADEARAKREEQALKRGKKRGRKRPHHNQGDPDKSAISTPSGGQTLNQHDKEEEQDENPVWYGDIRKFRGTRVALAAQLVVEDDQQMEELDISDEEWDHPLLDGLDQIQQPDGPNPPQEMDEVEALPEVEPNPEQAVNAESFMPTDDFKDSTVKSGRSILAKYAGAKAKALMGISVDSPSPNQEVSKTSVHRNPEQAGGGDSGNATGNLREPNTKSAHSVQEADAVAEAKVPIGKGPESKDQNNANGSDSDGPPEELQAAKSESVAVLHNKAEAGQQAKGPEVGQAKGSSRTEKAAREVEKRLLKRSKRPPTLLERLLKSEISRERDELLQCVRFVCARNFFEQAPMKK